MKYLLKNLSVLNLKNWPVYILIFFIIAGCSQEIKVPKTKSVTHFDEYHGQKVSDPYRWLEDFTSNEVKEWVIEQNDFSKQFAKNKYQTSIKEDLKSIWTSEYLSTPYKVQGKTFYYFNTGKLQHNKFMVRDCDSCKERVLIDPNQFSSDGTIALASASVSPDGEEFDEWVRPETMVGKL